MMLGDHLEMLAAPTVESLPRRQRGRPSRSQSELLVDRLIEIAAATFIERGYGNTSVAAIIERAGVTKKTFYRHFPTKADVFNAVVRRTVASAADIFTEDLAPLDIEQALYAIGSHMLALWQGRLIEIIRLIYAEAPRFPELGMVIAEMTREGERQVAAVLARVGGPDIDAERAATTFLEMLFMGPQRWLLLRPYAPYPEDRKLTDLRIVVELFAADWRNVFRRGGATR